MNIKVIYSFGGKYNKNSEQKLADAETVDAAKRVATALKRNGHQADTIRITPDKIDTVKQIKTDAVFNLVEWSGRDYPLAVKVLKNLENSNIPFTGADSKSYEWCCNKIAMKKMLDKLKIPSPKWTSVKPGDTVTTIEKKVNRLTFPIIIKPAFEHCAIGINSRSVIHTKKNFTIKIRKLLKIYKEPVLVEEFINGREFTTTVINNHKLRIFPPAEVLVKSKSPDKILSFKAKWTDSNESYKSVILKDKPLTLQLIELSKKTFKRMNCRSYVRIDFRMDDKKLYVLEVNINPSIWPEECYGLTVSTEAAGWDFNKLVKEIASSAISGN